MNNSQINKYYRGLFLLIIIIQSLDMQFGPSGHRANSSTGVYYNLLFLISLITN